MSLLACISALRYAIATGPKDYAARASLSALVAATPTPVAGPSPPAPTPYVLPPSHAEVLAAIELLGRATDRTLRRVLSSVPAVRDKIRATALDDASPEEVIRVATLKATTQRQGLELFERRQQVLDKVTAVVNSPANCHGCRLRKSAPKPIPEPKVSILSPQHRMRALFNRPPSPDQAQKPDPRVRRRPPRASKDTSSALYWV